MVVLAPISKNVRDTLYQKIAMLSAGAGKTVGRDENGNWVAKSTIANETVSGNAENYMFARTPYMVMTSLTPTEKGGYGPLIIQGGELNSFGQMAGKFDTTTQDFFETSDYDWSNDRGSKYTGYGSEHQMPLRPLAGVKDIAIEYKGGGMKLGATREATINWSCWSWEELERLTKHFLAPRRSILLEWGWSGIGDMQYTTLFPLYSNYRDNGLKFDEDKIANLKYKLPEHIQSQKGHYDAMLGLITSFDWSVNDTGGFDCSTVLVGQGISILQSQQKGNKYAKFESMGLLGARENVKITDIVFGKNTTVTELGIWQRILKQRSPYITFREYMSDFRQQVKFSHAPSDMKQPIIQIPTVINLKNIVKSVVPSEDYAKKGQTKYPPGRDYKMSFGFTPQDQFFCSWGWFEDNVLSRFFGKVTKRSGEDVILGEFRSISQAVTTDGILRYKPPTTVDIEKKEPLNQTNNFHISKYLITIDSSKWLIPRESDPIYKYLEVLPKQKEAHINKYKSDKDNGSMAIRDVMFNAGYLSEKMKGASDIVRSVLSVWDEFSRTYGGIYKFKAEFDDIPSRLSLVEEGYSRFKVEELLEGVKNKEKGGPSSESKLFVFPAMEHGSIVKSQTLNANLPDRMKLAAMYGVKKLTPEDQEETDYDRLSALAWGTLSSTKSPGDVNFDESGEVIKTQSQQQKQTYEDYMTGKIDSPSRGNRDFGQGHADHLQELWIGPVPGPGKISKIKYGTVIKASILDDLDQTQQEYIKKRKAQGSSGSETIGDEEEIDISDMKKLTKEFNDDFSFLIDDDGGSDKYYTANWKAQTKKATEYTTEVDAAPIPEGKEMSLVTNKKYHSTVPVGREMKEHTNKETFVDANGKFIGGQGVPDLDWIKDAENIGIYNRRTKGVKGFYFDSTTNPREKWKGGGNHKTKPEYGFKQHFQAILDDNDLDSNEITKVEHYYAIAVFAVETDGSEEAQEALIEWVAKILEKKYDNGTEVCEDEDPIRNAVLTGRITPQAILAYEENSDNTLIKDIIFPNEVSVDEYIIAVTQSHYHYAYMGLKPELIYELQKKLRADPEHGIIPKTNPLIPVDFEMEIDGTGGLFPGNSFHSSYFSSRYKEESVFQMVGVNHTIDSSGWFTTIKGQIRSVALPKSFSDDHDEGNGEEDTSVTQTIDLSNQPSGDDGQTEAVVDDTKGATSDNPFTESSLGESNKKAKAAGLKTFWWVNNYPGTYGDTPSGHKATW